MVKEIAERPKQCGERVVLDPTKHSRVHSSTIVRHFSVWPLAHVSKTKTKTKS